MLRCRVRVRVMVDKVKVKVRHRVEGGIVWVVMVGEAVVMLTLRFCESETVSW
jgi:hypothetical protein